MKDVYSPGFFGCWANFKNMVSGIMDAKKFLSIILGVLTAVAVFVICMFIASDIAVWVAILSGALSVLLIQIVLVISERYMDKKYAAIEKKINSRIFCKANGNFDLGYTVKNGMIYFCDDKIICVSVDEKPYAFSEILKSDIFRYDFDNVHLNIYTKEGRVFLITLPNVEAVVAELQNNNWIQ